MKIGFIGAGKVGFSLGRFLCDNGIHVTGYYSLHRESADMAAQFTGTKRFDDIGHLIEESDCIFLTVSDGAISDVLIQCKDYDISKKEIVHCSGALSIEGAYSVHPLFPISDRLNSYRELSGAFFCLEGDKTDEKTAKALDRWESFFAEHAAGVRCIEPKDKISYHAACAIASNLYVGLMYESVQILNRCGFSESEALMALTPLVKSNLDHILKDGPVNALTGPVERGDYETVEKHINSLATEQEKSMYVAVTEILKNIVEKRGL